MFLSNVLRPYGKEVVQLKKAAHWERMEWMQNWKSFFGSHHGSDTHWWLVVGCSLGQTVESGESPKWMCEQRWSPEARCVNTQMSESQDQGNDEVFHWSKYKCWQMIDWSIPFLIATLLHSQATQIMAQDIWLNAFYVLPFLALSHFQESAVLLATLTDVKDV